MKISSNRDGSITSINNRSSPIILTTSQASIYQTDNDLSAKIEVEIFEGSIKKSGFDRDDMVSSWGTEGS